MTDEEKKVIEYWEEKLKEYKKEIEQRQNDEFKGYGTAEDIAKLKYCNLHILLNLIQTQQEEIEKLKKTELKAKGGGIKVTLEGLLEIEKKMLELEEKIEKKDKIIDEMAKTLKWALNVGLGFIPSSICTCKEDIRNCEDKICTDCIKQYFTKKVEKE